jgi:hypothetical protein
MCSVGAASVNQWPKTVAHPILSSIFEEIWRRPIPSYIDIMTGDESWFYDCDPETKEQSKVWVPKNDSRPTKVHGNKSAGKRMVAVFFNEIWFNQDGTIRNWCNTNCKLVCQHLSTSSLQNCIKTKTKERSSKVSFFMTIMQDHIELGLSRNFWL